ncbi:MAG: outer membrane lipoprotein carrier protein LolA [Opitutaceae bacterium]|nr:outer membrane lipoprotein carrier protein LolA [Opitutaceae bacterium]
MSISVHQWLTLLGILCVVFSELHAAEPLPLPPETLLADPANDPAWRDLFTKLAPTKTRQSKFEERRFFPFRKEPVVLTGEVRIVPELGLSLRYLSPEKNTLIADAKGLLLRDDLGRERTPPNDSRAQAATSALVRVLRFDLAALQRDFAVHGRREGAAWTLSFVSREPAFTTLLGTLTIRGENGALRAIEIVKSPTQRIEITIRDSVEDVLFTGDTLKRFFR